MEPDLPRGQQARAAWRSLSPQARASAYAAARRGAAPDDLGVAWVAAGYGRLVSRRLRIVWLLAPIWLLAVAFPVGISLVLIRASRSVLDTSMAVLLVGILAGMIGLRLWARRYQRLYSCGLLGIEASQLGAAAPSPVPSAWSVAPGESEFTVPLHAQLPLTHPASTAVTDPVAAGVYEIPVRRGRIAMSLLLLIGTAALMWLVVISLWSDASRDTPVFLTVVTVAASGVTLLVVFILYAVGPAMRQSVAARFTPEGWEIPPLGIRGSWAEVRAIRVRPLATRGSMAANPRMATVRAVALIVDDPVQRVAHLSLLRRALIRSTITKFGSPATIVASPRRTLPVVEMVQLLQRYTAAPVYRA
jgi:hypothetical protein